MNDNSMPASGERRPYQAPKLEELGSLAELTAGGGGTFSPADSATYYSS